MRGDVGAEGGTLPTDTSVNNTIAMLCTAKMASCVMQSWRRCTPSLSEALDPRDGALAERRGCHDLEAVYVLVSPYLWVLCGHMTRILSCLEGGGSRGRVTSCFG